MQPGSVGRASPGLGAPSTGALRGSEELTIQVEAGLVEAPIGGTGCSTRAGRLPAAGPASRLPSTLDTPWLRRHLEQVLQMLSDRWSSVAVRVVGDATMARLHGKYLGDPTTTDVLTFWEDDESANADDEGPHQPDGLHRRPSPTRSVDLVVCLDEAHRQSASRGHSLERELLLYVIHGLLHCCGHDDRTEADAAAMHAEEDRILEALGVGSTFSRPVREPEGPTPTPASRPGEEAA